MQYSHYSSSSHWGAHTSSSHSHTSSSSHHTTPLYSSSLSFLLSFQKNRYHSPYPSYKILLKYFIKINPLMDIGVLKMKTYTFVDCGSDVITPSLPPTGTHTHHHTSSHIITHTHIHTYAHFDLHTDTHIHHRCDVIFPRRVTPHT